MTHTKRLLAAGVVAGPVFIGVSLAHAFARDGFDLRRHPLSLLSLGRPGWLQIATFVVAGVLVVACAVGVRRALHPGLAGTWGPLLVGCFGLGLIMSGVFVTDAGAGFPAGAPAGAPPEITWHGWLHSLGSLLAFVGMAAGCLVFARRFARRRERGWLAASIGTAVGSIVLSAPGPPEYSIRLVLAAALLLAYLGALALHLNRHGCNVPDAAAAYRDVTPVAHQRHPASQIGPSRNRTENP
jgi:hypothetical membrane protein